MKPAKRFLFSLVTLGRGFAARIFSYCKTIHRALIGQATFARQRDKKMLGTSRHAEPLEKKNNYHVFAKF